MKRQEAQSACDKKGVYKFSPESEDAVTLMDDLKVRVKATEDKVHTVLYPLHLAPSIDLYIFAYNSHVEYKH